MIRVLVVEDSLPVRMQLRQILETDPGIRVEAMVNSGEAALEYLAQNRARIDIVTMDIVMPGMNGYAATRRIMETTPLPIVIISATYKHDEAEKSFQALECGAVAIIEKPVAITHAAYPERVDRIIKTVKLMSGVKVFTRHAGKPKKEETIRAGDTRPPGLKTTPDLLVIGSSTGGPPALRSIFTLLPRDLPAPILMVQHINPGFIGAMAHWLEGVTGIRCRIPTGDEHCKPGQVYLGPDDCHMGIGPGHRVVLDKSGPINGHRPSVAYLFRSAARNYPNNAVGIILSGMGTDGAAELKMMKDSGSITIAQDEASSVVFGMPGQAVKLNAAQFVLPPNKIAEKIIELFREK